MVFMKQHNATHISGGPILYIQVPDFRGLVLHYKERIAERQSQQASSETSDPRLLELRGALQEAGQDRMATCTRTYIPCGKLS